MGVIPSSDTRDCPPAGALPGFLAGQVRLAYPTTGLAFALAAPPAEIEGIATPS